MNFDFIRFPQLLPRNEGKIKSYSSCADLRAWSHDLRMQDRYLREWIKCDMPISIIPTCCIIRLFNQMTCSSKSKTAPRCHRDCKSKVILDTINKSCHVMRQCLKESETFYKYFEEEELETSHWPCEKCLDALKSVKMLWKVIIEKIFGTNLSKIHISNDSLADIDNVETLASSWQTEIVQQADIVKRVSVHACKEEMSILRLKDIWKRTDDVHESFLSRETDPFKTLNIGNHSPCRRRGSKTNSNRSTIKSRSLDPKFECSTPKSFPQRSNTTINIVKTVDVGCDSCNFQKEQDELRMCKAALKNLQEQFNVQLNKINKLQDENINMKVDLLKAKQLAKVNDDKSAIICLPKSRETTRTPGKSVDSETIITMKNCKNETFKHVSVLQVTHKSNQDALENCLAIDIGKSKKEDPIALLQKVHNTFGAMVRREVTIINNEAKRKTNMSDINAKYEKLTAMTKSTVSCTTLSSLSASSLSNFMSVGSDTSKRTGFLKS